MKPRPPARLDRRQARARADGGADSSFITVVETAEQQRFEMIVELDESRRVVEFLRQ